MKIKEKIINVILNVIVISISCVVIYIIMAMYDQLLITDTNDKFEYKDNKWVFTETKCLMGSVFNKKTLILSDDNIEIISHSLFGKEKKTVRPYNNIKEAIFSKAFIGYKGYGSGYKVVIKYSDGFFNESDKFYFNQKDTFDLLKIAFKDYSKNRCVITESL